MGYARSLEQERRKMSVQKAIFPGMLVGFFMFFGIVALLTNNAKKFPDRSEVVVLQAGMVLAPEVQPQAVLADVQPAPANLAVWDGTCTIAGGYPESVKQWCDLIERYARENGLDPNLVSAVMLQESAGKPDAYSKSGAVGLLQVMPRDGLASKFMCKNGPCFTDRPSMEELFAPEFNVAYGSQMLAKLIQYHGNIRDALKAYGPKDVGYYYADLVLNTVSAYR
jgi:soluble lytic murein transglycosylase-like protein